MSAINYNVRDKLYRQGEIILLRELYCYIVKGEGIIMLAR
jgi:hypothetical protein